MKKCFIVDLGHVPQSGARALNGRNEHAIVKSIAELLVKRAKARGYRAILVDYPQLSNSADLRETIAHANDIHEEVDFGISLHADSSKNPSARGAHACYVSDGGALLAQCLVEPLVKLMPGRALKLVYRQDLAMLKQTIDVWSLLELGFLTNVGDLAMLENNPESFVEAILKGVDKYYQLRKQGVQP